MFIGVKVLKLFYSVWPYPEMIIMNGCEKKF